MANIGVIAASAGGVEHLRQRLVAPLLDRGHRVAVTLTPTAARWLRAIDEVEPIADLTELPVRSEPRLPGESGQHPQIDVYVAAPLTATSTAKLALGIGDNQALTVLCESITTVPMIVVSTNQRGTCSSTRLVRTPRSAPIRRSALDLRSRRLAAV